MEMAQQYCLRWNNYQSTINHIFHKLLFQERFIDCTLVVEGQYLKCHRLMLSACSTYFEEILADHDKQPGMTNHPLIILQDIPYKAMKALIHFMYNGEINVSREDLATLLKVAEMLKVKGLADSDALSNFSKKKLLIPEPPRVAPTANSAITSQPPAPVSYSPYIPPVVPFTAAQNSYNLTKNVYTNYMRAISQANQSQLHEKKVDVKYNARNSPSPVDIKRRRKTDSPASLPPSPPISLGSGEIQNGEVARASPALRVQAPEASIKLETDVDPESVKNETEEETDCELQIDESACQSDYTGTDSDMHSSQNTPGSVPVLCKSMKSLYFSAEPGDSRESQERTETAQCLAALASQGSPFHFLPHSILKPKHSTPINKSGKKGKSKVRVRLNRNGQKGYTASDLELGIELVIAGSLTPAAAIIQYNVPRRTFFRRLAVIRVERGLKPAKETFPTRRRKKSDKSSDGAGCSSLAPNDNVLNLHQPSAASKSPDSTMDDEKKTANGVLSLLSMTSNSQNSYEYYWQLMKQKQLADKENPPTIDDNSNLADNNNGAQNGH